MPTSNALETADFAFAPAGPREASASGVSWGAVIGGAFISAALSLILLALGAGFGLSTVSPWSIRGASASTVGAIAIAWLLAMQIVASGMGGYLTGRLRVKWHATHGDEVHFRDTANGFLAWAVALVITAAFLTTAASAMAGRIEASDTANRSGGPAAGLAADPNAYFVDRLFRSDHMVTTEGDAVARAEAAKIFSHYAWRSEVPPSDTAYLAELVAARTGLSASDASKRVADVIADARQSEDNTRAATAHLLLWLFLALLTGAFCASYAATVGGRQRDRVQTI
jgi:hypothetical protein